VILALGSVSASCPQIRGASDHCRLEPRSPATAPPRDWCAAWLRHRTLNGAEIEALNFIDSGSNGHGLATHGTCVYRDQHKCCTIQPMLAAALIGGSAVVTVHKRNPSAVAIHRFSYGRAGGPQSRLQKICAYQASGKQSTPRCNVRYFSGLWAVECGLAAKIWLRSL
jgi:hypothetical protein